MKLTRAELTLLLSIAAALTLGTLTRHYRKSHPAPASPTPATRAK